MTNVLQKSYIPTLLLDFSLCKNYSNGSDYLLLYTFYILPNTSYVKNFILFVGGSQGVPELLGFVRRFFLLKQKNYFVLGVPNVKTKIFIFEYFPNISLEMNSIHPFYPSLIPNILNVKRSFYSSQNSLKKLMISKNYFNWEV